MVNSNGNGQAGFFFAMPGFVSPFSTFKSRATVDPPTGNFLITGRFRPARGNRINPASQPVSLLLQTLMYNGLYSLSVSLPPGSFRRVSEDDPVYEFSGTVPGGTMRMFIRSSEDDGFSFTASGTSIDLLFPYFPITPYPDAFFLSIGNSAGETVPAP